jgi:hypothetical protein
MGFLDWLMPVLGLVGTGGSLGIQGDLRKKIEELTSPGGQPGTNPAGSELYTSGNTPSWMAGMPAGERETLRNYLNQMAQYDPRTIPYALQMGETERKRQGLLTDIGTMRTEAEGSALKPIAERMGQQASTLEARRGTYDTRLDKIAGDVDSYYRNVMANPTVMTQQEMDAIVGKMIGDSNTAYASQMGQAQAESARRGFGAGASQAIQEQVKGENYRANLDKAATVAGINASERAKRGDAAAAALGTIIPGIYGTGSNIDTALAGLALQALTGQANTMGSYEGVLRALSGAAADVRNQPMNLFAPGEMFQETGQYNTALQTQSDTALANLLAQIGGGGMQNWAAIKQAGLMQPPSTPWWQSLGQMVPGIVGGVGSFFG